MSATTVLHYMTPLARVRCANCGALGAPETMLPEGWPLCLVCELTGQAEALRAELYGPAHDCQEGCNCPTRVSARRSVFAALGWSL